MTYRAPINDILLSLNHGAGLAAAVAAGHYGDFDSEITAAVLEEAGKFAADVLAPVHERTGGADGFVSLEVDPRLARDAAGTVAQARELAAAVDRRNLMVKIPATVEGLSAIADVLGEGISVNVTLIFSLPRYRRVLNAWLTGLEKARANGHDVRRLHSVASFFVSRVDTEVDARLRAIGTPEAEALTGRAAVANARLAYRAFEQALDSERWRLLEAAGAPVQGSPISGTGSTLVDARRTESVPLTTSPMPRVSSLGEGESLSPHGGRRRAPQDPAPAATAGETPTDENEGLPAEAGERPERQDGEEVTQRGTTGRVEGEPRGEGRVG